MKFLNCVGRVFLLVALTATGVSAAEKVKVTEEEQRQALTMYRVYGGITARGYAYMVVQRPGGERELYWNTFNRFAVWRGKAFLKNGETCITYDESPDEKCYYSFRLEDGTLENYLNDGTLSSTSKMIYEGKVSP